MKWRTLIAGVVALPVLISMAACGGKSELGRSKAQKVIQASDKFTPGAYPWVFLTDDLERVGLQQGLWGQGGSLTPKGKTYFKSHPLSGSLEPKPLPRRVIEVTGISDGPGAGGASATVKDVQFIWDWENVPKEVKPFLGAKQYPVKGEALLKLYDDGWRVEEIKAD